MIYRIFVKKTHTTMNNQINSIILFVATLIVSFTNHAQLPGSGNAYDFNSNYISIPDAPSLNPNAISIEAWIKADNWAANSWENVIVSKDGWATGDQGYTLRAGANGTLSFNVSIAGTWEEVTSPSGSMSTGEWYHVAGVYDGATMSVYINGELMNSISLTGNIVQGNYALHFGRIAYTVGGTRYFDGMIDEVRIWDGGIPQSSIQEFMCKKLTASHPDYASLIGHWNFDDAGSVLDSSPNGNNGTVSGSTHVPSGAAIGDVSVFDYASGSVDLTLDWMMTDNVTVTSSSTINTVHLYRVDESPNSTATNGSVDSLNHSHYYGVFASSPSAFTYNLTHYYGTTPMAVGNDTYLALAGRNNPGETNWMNQTAAIDPVLKTATKSFSESKEVMLALACPSVSLNLTGPVNLCDNETVNIAAQTTNPSYAWHDATGPIPSATTSSYTASTAGSYYLVANDGACSDTSWTVIVNSFTNPIVDFGIVSNLFCESDADETIQNASPIGGTYSGTGIVGNDFSPTAAGVGLQTLYYSYTDGNGCSNIDSLEVTVQEAPSISVINDDQGELCINSSGTGNTYTWILDGNVVSTSTDTCFTAVVNGTYEVFATNANGCDSDTSSILLNYIGLNDIEFESSINVSPNPVNEKLFVTLSEGIENAIITLTDANGRVLNQFLKQNNTTELNFNLHEAGIYFIIVQVDGNKAVKRIVKY